MVKVTGVSKGKGFPGTIRRHNFTRGPDSHGSHNVRAPGSIGAAADAVARLQGHPRCPARWATRVTQRGLEIVDVGTERNLLLVRGAVPGPEGSVRRDQEGCLMTAPRRPYLGRAGQRRRSPRPSSPSRPQCRSSTRPCARSCGAPPRAPPRRRRAARSRRAAPSRGARRAPAARASALVRAAPGPAAASPSAPSRATTASRSTARRAAARCARRSALHAERGRSRSSTPRLRRALHQAGRRARSTRSTARAACSWCSADDEVNACQALPQHRRRERAAAAASAWPTSSAPRALVLSSARPALERTLAESGRPRERPPGHHPPGRLREELRPARGQQVHVPRPHARTRRRSARRSRRSSASRTGRPHRLGQAQAQAPRLHQRPPPAAGRRRS